MAFIDTLRVGFVAGSVLLADDPFRVLLLPEAVSDADDFVLLRADFGALVEAEPVLEDLCVEGVVC